MLSLDLMLSPAFYTYIINSQNNEKIKVIFWERAGKAWHGFWKPGLAQAWCRRPPVSLGVGGKWSK